MRTEGITMKFILSALALSMACTTAIAQTPEDRCENIADYAKGVAELRDQGVRLRDVLEIVEERASSHMADVYKRAAKIVYQNSGASPDEVHDGMLEGCLSTVTAEKASRAGALKTAF